MKKTMKKVESFISTVKEKINTFFDAAWLKELALKTKFIVRNSNRINSRDFVQLVSLEILSNPMMSNQNLCDILAEINPKSRISDRALQQRMASKGAADFLGEVLDQLLTQSLTETFDQTPPELLAPFDRVWLQDSSCLILNQKLAATFRGTGGSASKSALKLNLIYEHHQRQIHQVIVTDGVASEAKLGEEIFAKLVASDLVIRDLAYLTLDGLKQIDSADAFFLSRIVKGVSLFLTDDPSARAIDLPTSVNKQLASAGVIEQNIYLGQEKFPARLIAYRAPDEVVNLRRRKAYNSARKKGRTPSHEHLAWLAFNFYITNVDSSTWPAKCVGTIYRIRWQIELIFKQWKSLLGIDSLRGSCPARIRCLVYGRLIAVILMSMIYRSLCCYAYAVFDTEPSVVKLTQWLILRGRLARAVYNSCCEQLFAELKATAKTLLKQKRFRRTTLELIDQQVSFQHSFQVG